MELKNAVKKVESVALVISAIGALFKLMFWKGGPFMLIIGLSTLCVCHLILASQPESKSRKAVIVNYLRHVSLAILFVGGLFYLMRWAPNPMVMIQIGGAGLIISLAMEHFWEQNPTEKP